MFHDMVCFSKYPPYHKTLRHRNAEPTQKYAEDLPQKTAPAQQQTVGGCSG